MMRSLMAFFFLFAVISKANAQSGYSVSQQRAEYIRTFNPLAVRADYSPRLESKEAPVPSGDEYRQYLTRVKERINARYPANEDATRRTKGPAPQPILIRDMGTYWNHPLDGPKLHVGGTPNDNTVAVSEDGFLLCSWNSALYAHDLNADTALFKPNAYQTTIGLGQFADTVSTDDIFDPKLIYDPFDKKFIALFLSVNRTQPGNYRQSKTVIAFSTTSNPKDPWHVYQVNGHPKGGQSWSDYPAATATRDELFLTINLVENGKGWIDGFNETIIWQIDKKQAYQGIAPTMKLWSDIKHQGKPLRYICPVQHGDASERDDLYFVANRSVPVEFEDTLSFSSDSIFLLHIDKKQTQAPMLTLKATRADCRYHTPPNGRQANQHTLFTNDARVLGGVLLMDESIHFVGNTLDSTSGRAGIYHGILTNISSPNPTAQIHIIGHPTLDLGYPNIATTETVSGERELIVGANHTSPVDSAGISAIFYTSADGHSEWLKIKAGTDYVNRINSPKPEYERWGDYTGMQRDWSKPKQVWMSGYYGMKNNEPGSWYAQLSSPYAPAAVQEGKPPKAAANVYPLPFSNRFTAEFELAAQELLTFSLYAANGTLKTILGKISGYKGSNTFSFDSTGLPAGIYTLRITGQKTEMSRTVVKN